MTQVNKPVLLRRLFQLGCIYSSQILSYTKMLGQLQEAGNTTTLAHYLELLAGAGLLDGLEKYSSQPVRQRSSSPKFCVFNTALASAQSLKSFHEAKQDPAFWGRLVESTVGAHLLNKIRGTGAHLFYWREKKSEIDFVLQLGSKVIAIEVKSNHESFNKTGLDEFTKLYHPKHVYLVGERGIKLEDFLQIPINDLF